MFECSFGKNILTMVVAMAMFVATAVESNGTTKTSHRVPVKMANVVEFNGIVSKNNNRSQSSEFVLNCTVSPITMILKQIESLNISYPELLNLVVMMKYNGSNEKYDNLLKQIESNSDIILSFGKRMESICSDVKLSKYKNNELSTLDSILNTMFLPLNEDFTLCKTLMFDVDYWKYNVISMMAKLNNNNSYGSGNVEKSRINLLKHLLITDISLPIPYDDKTQNQLFSDVCSMINYSILAINTRMIDVIHMESNYSSLSTNSVICEKMITSINNICNDMMITLKVCLNSSIGVFDEPSVKKQLKYRQLDAYIQEIKKVPFIFKKFKEHNIYDFGSLYWSLCEEYENAKTNEQKELIVKTIIDVLNTQIISNSRKVLLK